MDAKVSDGTMVGGMGVIARNGKIVYSQTYGQADREAKRAMEADAIYRIYSMTKPVTGVALMMLYEEGKFRLNDPVAMYIPELAKFRGGAIDCWNRRCLGRHGKSRRWRE